MRREILADGAEMYLGDCREILPAIDNIDALVTSPPYNCGKDYGSASDQMDLDDYKKFLIDTIGAAKARVKVINVGQYVGSRGRRERLADIVHDAMGARPIDEVLWDKGPANGAAWGNFPNSPRIRAQHESILVYGDARMPTGNGCSWAEWSALTTSIWRVAPNVDLSIHPAMMPVEIARRAIQLWTDIDGLTVDPFAGSGTTGVACARLGRRFTGVEIEPKHFDTACRRIADELSRPRLKLDSGHRSGKREALL